jgi:hypothetical protein
MPPLPDDEYTFPSYVESQLGHLAMQGLLAAPENPDVSPPDMSGTRQLPCIADGTGRTRAMLLPQTLVSLAGNWMGYYGYRYVFVIWIGV